jgi:ribosome recycling factor
MAINLKDIAKDLEDKSKKTTEHFKKELSRARTGRAHTSILDGLTVEYYGSFVPLIQLGVLNAPEPRLLTIQVYDSGAVEAVERAIMQADLGLNPSRDGNLVRIAIPALNEERRKEIVKRLHKLTEDNRVALRNHRREVLDQLKKREKEKEISSDEIRRATEEVQKVVDKYIKEMDSLLAAKEKEVLEV